MEIPKLLLLLSCVYYATASHHKHIIPVDGYESHLQDLGQHVEIPETPVKVIKITKTIAVKIPVPYPVKVREKVPYPVQVAKPYPVPVPQIIKVPHIVTASKSSSDGGSSGGNIHRLGQEGNSYSVQEPQQQEGHSFESGGHSFGAAPQSFGSAGHSFGPASQSFGSAGHSFEPAAQSFGSAGQSYEGGSSDQNQNFGGDYSYEGSPGSSYDAPATSYQGYSAPAGGAAHESEESQSYDQALQDYFSKQKSSGNQDGSGYYY